MLLVLKAVLVPVVLVSSAVVEATKVLVRDPDVAATASVVVTVDAPMVVSTAVVVSSSVSIVDRSIVDVCGLVVRSGVQGDVVVVICGDVDVLDDSVIVCQ